jgi:hypothetical protein
MRNAPLFEIYSAQIYDRTILLRGILALRTKQSACPHSSIRGAKTEVKKNSEKILRSRSRKISLPRLYGQSTKFHLHLNRMVGDDAVLVIG